MDLVASSLYGAWIVSPKALGGRGRGSTNYFESGIDARHRPLHDRVVHAGQGGPAGQVRRLLGRLGRASTTTRCWSRSRPRRSSSSRCSTAATSTSRSSCPLENIASYKDNPDYTFIDEPSFFNYVGFFNTDKHAARRPQGPPGAVVRDPLRRHHHGRRPGLRHAVPRPRAGRRVPVRRPTSRSTTRTSTRPRRCCTEAGHDGGGFKIDLTYAAENQAEARFAPLIKDAFAKIGVDVTLTPMLFNQQWERPRAIRPGARTCSCCSTGRPTATRARTTCGRCSTAARSRSSTSPTGRTTTYDKLVDDASASTATERDQAQAKYSEAMKLLVDQAPGVFFYDTRCRHRDPEQDRRASSTT